MSLLFDVFRNSILITGLVMVMMLLIEYIHIFSRGRSFSGLNHHPMRQIVLAALLGLIPGCIGGFAAVSLYAHGIISFGALTAMMVSAMGDEAFVLFATVPKTGFLIVALLFPLALLTGWLADRWAKNKKPVSDAERDCTHGCQHPMEIVTIGNWRENIRQTSLIRATLLIGLFAFMLALGFGLFEHDEHEHNIFNERWFNLIFTVIAMVTLILTAIASNHFISEHLWGHIIKKHLLKIFLWTFGALLFITIGLQYLHLEHWIEQNGFIVLLMAALIGLIPESGPHLIFIALFASGVTPFSVLFVNFFVQDGHTALPLLADHKRDFIKVKAMKFFLGIAMGSLLYFCGI